MGLNTYPSNPFPPSTDRMDADALETEVSKLNNDVSELKSGLTNYETTKDTKDIIGWNRNPNLCTIQKQNNVVIARAKQGETYTFSLKELGSVGWSIKKNTNDGATVASSDNPTFTADEDFDIFLNGYSYVSGTGFVDLTENYQLENGSTATTFEPYHPVIGPAVEELQSGLNDVTTQIQGLNSVWKMTRNSAGDITFTTQDNRFTGFLLITGNDGKYAIYTINVSLAGGQHIIKLIGDDYTITYSSGTITATINASWSKVTLVTDTVFT